MTLTAQVLAKTLFEELARDDWGDIDTFLLEHAADEKLNEEDFDDEDLQGIKGLTEALERTVERLKALS